MLETEDGRARNLGPADAATLLRAWLVPAVAADGGAGLCALGFASDVADGVLARATEPTRLGRDLESVADACFGVAAIRGLRRSGRLGPVAERAEGARVAIGFAATVAIYLGRAQPPPVAVARAGRAVAPVRAAGVLAGGLGWRRTADALTLAGCGASVAVTLRALRTQEA